MVTIIQSYIIQIMIKKCLLIYWKEGSILH